ncbi:MAG: MDR family MFS transporter [Actinobacteria bacterium]|nr:MDR family MFS transporter [Actinomycetota bacterium]
MATETLVPGFTNKRLWIVLGALALAVMLANLETSIIATALPTITGQFNAFESFAWVGTAYIVTSAISTPLLGKLSDLYGRRLIFQSTMAVFLVGSILCGASQSMGQLIAARAFQGMGGGGIQALAFAILGDILPPRERGRYMGYFTLAFVGSAILGPLVGGLIIDHASWPWIFYINVPFVILVGGVCHFALRLPFKRRKAKLDFMGAGLLSLTIASLMIGLEEGRHGWTQQHVLILFVIALLGLGAFIKVEQRAEEPMIPLRLFSNDVVRTCALLGMCAGVVTYGAGGFLSLYFQDSLLVSPTESGLRTLPQMLGVTLATFGIGRIIAKTGKYKIFPIVGSVLSFCGLIGVAQITGTTPYLFLVIPMILMGFGTASIFTTTSIASQNAVDFSDLGVATATVMFFRSLGGSFGLAIFGTVLNSTIRSEIPKQITIDPDKASSIIRSPQQIATLPLASKQAVIDSLALGVSRIYWLCAATMVIGLLLAIILREQPLRLRAGLSDAMEKNEPATA